jgi:hypothetical protein
MEAHEAHEQHEQLEHAAHGGGEGGHGGGHNKRIAILIAILAALLAVVDSGGKGAQNEQVTANIKASDTWAFYQAKNIRQSVIVTSSALLQALTPEGIGGDQAARINKLEADWKAAADKLEASAESNGKKELMAKAHEYEEERDLALAAYHNFEFGGAALQLGIVLASASVITGMPALALVAAGLGVLGTTLGGLGWFAPELLHHLLG